ncbi:unnamed protein product [Arctogadus glacialis]
MACDPGDKVWKSVISPVSLFTVQLRAARPRVRNYRPHLRQQGRAAQSSSASSSPHLECFSAAQRKSPWPGEKHHSVPEREPDEPQEHHLGCLALSYLQRVLGSWPQAVPALWGRSPGSVSTGPISLSLLPSAWAPD